MLKKNSTVALSAASVLFAQGLFSVAQAQVSDPLATDLQISPRFTVDLNTPRNGDNDKSFGRVGAFFPVFQTPGRRLTFMDALGRIDARGNLGGSVSLGHRLALNARTVLGGYVAYDVRNTGEATFNQVGLGAEVLGENWATHLNGYIPVGTTRRLVGGNTTGDRMVDAQFQNNQLLLITGGAQTFESALGGVEASADFKLGGFGDYGDLWGGASVYYLGDALGGSAQLDHRVGDRFRLGVGAQSDGVFGTQVFASIGASLGGGRSPADSSKADSVWPQVAGGAVERNSSIAVRSEVRGVERESQVAVDPETGQTYAFLHVTPDSTAANEGDGTVERPFTTLGTGSADTDNTGLRTATAGEVVYVRAGDSRENAIAPFTIPAGVQVYSDAIAMTLPTQLGTVPLPNSGTDSRPLIDANGSNGITLVGGNNRVGGFEINGSTNGIVLTNPVGNVVVENNLIRNAANRALSLEQSTGAANVTIAGNTISNANNDGIRVELADVADLTLTLNNNQIDGVIAPTGDGIDIEANGSSRAALTITNNQVENAGNSGIELETCGDTAASACNASFTAEVSDNTVSNSGGDGILFFHNSDRAAQLSITNNQVRQSGTQQTGITRNTDNPLPANGNGGFGIAVATFADGDLSLMIENNAVTDSRDEKIAVINNLQTNTASGLTAAAPVVEALIQGNTLSDGGVGAIAGTDVLVISGSEPGTPNTPALCLQLQDNATANGYFLANGLAAALAASPPILLSGPGTFEQAAGNSTDRLVTTGTLNLPPFGPVTASSAGSTTGNCALP